MAKSLRSCLILDDVNEPVNTLLGPFYDLDGMEILPVLTEATEAAIEGVMGRYRIHTNIPSLDSKTLVIDNWLAARYIQDKRNSRCRLNVE